MTVESQFTESLEWEQKEISAQKRLEVVRKYVVTNMPTDDDDYWFPTFQGILERLEEYKEPERMFVFGYGIIEAVRDEPSPQSHLGFGVDGRTKYWEIMPDETYRRLSDEELEALRT